MEFFCANIEYSDSETKTKGGRCKIDDDKAAGATISVIQYIEDA